MQFNAPFACATFSGAQSLEIFTSLGTNIHIELECDAADLFAAVLEIKITKLVPALLKPLQVGGSCPVLECQHVVLCFVAKAGPGPREEVRFISNVISIIIEDNGRRAVIVGFSTEILGFLCDVLDPVDFEHRFDFERNMVKLCRKALAQANGQMVSIVIYFPGDEESYLLSL